MAFRRSFALGLIVRLAALFAGVALFALSIETAHLLVARLLAGLLVVAAGAALWHHVDRTNREVARFVEAVRHRDFTQTFSKTSGSGFDTLGHSLESAIRALREERVAAGDESRMLAALVEEAPSALLLLDEEERVTLSNKAARKLFRHLPGTRIADFAGYGADLVRLLGEDGSTTRRLIVLRAEDAVQRAVASRSVLDRAGRRVVSIAIQPISEELSEVELAAQANLVRVLTHEIMNSLTPVVSLAQSAATLIAETDDGSDPAIRDARLAVETLARRTGGILHFVETYRAFARPPEVDIRTFDAAPWSRELEKLFHASPAAEQARLETTLDRDDLRIEADPDLLAQVVINLLKNAAEAAAQAPDAQVRLSFERAAGGKTRIIVEDNGPGIAEDQAGDIFLPFFTTKPNGTGVGLSLARRIVTAHRGSIEFDRGELGGARFALLI